MMKRLFAFLAILVIASPCLATNYDYKTMTPEIQKALQNRQARYYQLQSLKKQSAVGENNKGYVTALKEDAATSTLVSAENRDRRVLYEALAEQNALGGNGLLEVQRAFAEVQSDKASSGEMVQNATGAWEKKS